MKTSNKNSRERNAEKPGHDKKDKLFVTVTISCPIDNARSQAEGTVSRSLSIIGTICGLTFAPDLTRCVPPTTIRSPG